MVSIQPTRISRATVPAGVSVHVGALVLHGFDARDQATIAAAMEGELTRIVAKAPRVPSYWGPDSPTVTSTLPTRSFDVPAGAGAQQIGTGIAHSLARSLFGEPSEVTR